MQVVVLNNKSDVEFASPGRYVVHSGTTAYFPAMALIESDNANFLGEYYDDDGRAVLLEVVGTAHLAGLGEAEEEEVGTRRVMQIDPHYFTAALKDYNNWRIKWWREAVQNAVDAKASEIRLTAVENPDGSTTVSCEDNGTGMSRDILLNKFLRLGATTKVGAQGQAGGFGKAKELLLLPWLGWKIHTQDTIATGHGIEHQVNSAPYRQGTLLEVTMPADNTTDSTFAIGFIEKCYLPHIRFSVNGKVIPALLRGEDMIGQVPDKADIYYTKLDYEQSYAYVRTRGLFMFERYVSRSRGIVLIELTAPSIEILTANRDGFSDHETARAIDKLAERIAKDTFSAFRQSRGMIRKKYEGSGKFKAKQRSAELLAEIGPTQAGFSNASIDAITQTVGEFARRESEDAINALPPIANIADMLDMKFSGADHMQAAIKQLVWQPDFYVVNEIDGFIVPKKFFPETMTPTIKRLARTWVELCRFVLIQLGSDTEFGVGFIFSTDAGACALTEGENRYSVENWLMVNPFKDLYSRTEVYRPTRVADLQWLYAAAIHEATHIADGLSYHDEAFASALTRNMAKCANGFRKIQKIVKGLRLRDEVEADED